MNGKVGGSGGGGDGCHTGKVSMPVGVSGRRAIVRMLERKLYMEAGGGFCLEICQNSSCLYDRGCVQGRRREGGLWNPAGVRKTVVDIAPQQKGCSF